MNERNELFGLTASVIIEFDGSIDELCKLLSKVLIAAPYSIENRKTPPYDIVASYEVFGLEGWVERYNFEKISEYLFSLDSYAFIGKGDMIDSESRHDVSLFYAKLIGNICNLKTRTAK